MAVFRFTNNTQQPINVATSWAGVVQQCQNGILPGATAALTAEFGQHDVAVAFDLGDNGFSHDGNVLHAFELAGVLVLDAVVLAGSSAVAIATLGAGSELVVAGVAFVAGVTATTIEGFLVSNGQLKTLPGAPFTWEINVSGGPKSHFEKQPNGTYNKVYDPGGSQMALHATNDQNADTRDAS